MAADRPHRHTRTTLYLVFIFDGTMLSFDTVKLYLSYGRTGESVCGCRRSMTQRHSQNLTPLDQHQSCSTVHRGVHRPRRSRITSPDHLKKTRRSLVLFYYFSIKKNKTDGSVVFFCRCFSTERTCWWLSSLIRFFLAGDRWVRRFSC